ncbi:MAG TPA: RDD family protein, partial [Chthoniobacteraceae bacterium]|nr:RDD family protein [Chthoniobacteraceae bacterium]
TVKVGDFGLSISTTTRGDSALTLAGSVLGTPEFSSPEQLRGEALDLRADIYSVGMTLYFLLTGETAFRGENVVQLLATVLDKPAPSPRTLRPEIPEALARIVLRCLEKQAGDRFKNYDELRRALLPFNSTAPTPATLGLRFVAGVIDFLVFTPVGLAAMIFGGFDGMMDGSATPSPYWLAFAIGSLVLQIAYFAVSEGLWGATPGKALVGLRVGGLDRNAPGIPRALLRALIYLVPAMVSLLRFREPGGAPMSMAWNFGVGAAVYLYPALLAVTARRRNGFATIIDLLTKTRVIQKSAYEPRELIAQIEEPVATTDAMPKVGPYHVLVPLRADGDGELLLGYDTKLMRRVWIRRTLADAAPVTTELRNAARPGRLRWLQGHRNGAGSWAAYEAAPGTPLTALLRTPQPWKNVRHWLLDLATEFAAATSDGSMPATLSLDRVWITASGGAKLLDFRAPGADATVESLPGTEAAAFLNQLAISALEGRVATAEEARTTDVRVPVAIRARSLLSALRVTEDFAAIAGQLGSLVQQIPGISRRRRLGLIAGCVIPSVMMGGFGMFGMMAAASWQKKDPDVMRLKIALINDERMQRRELPPGVDRALEVKAMETLIAGRFERVLSEPVWSSPYAQSVLWKEERQRGEQIVARHGKPSAEEIAAARATLGNTIGEAGEFQGGSRHELKEQTQFMMWPIALSGFVWAAFLSVAAALICRGGLLMRALGIAVVKRDGSEASRGRMLWRACVAWSWLPLTGILVAVLVPVAGVNMAVAIPAILLVSIVIWSGATPGRSLQDRLAGTWLVPR